MTIDDQFLLLACDGLFDVFTYDEIVDFVKKQMEDHRDAQKCCEVCIDDMLNMKVITLIFVLIDSRI